MRKVDRLFELYTDPVWGFVQKGNIHIHPPFQCEGHPCPFHNPSDHHMVEWTKTVRLDKAALVERICPDHGTGHPDPDSLAYLAPRRPEMALGVHGCCGCCSPDKPLP